jgi:uracil-DNA glycosylase
MNTISQRRFVHSSGPRDAKIALIGEAPGEQEEAQGQPFIGWAGAELNRTLNDATILRNDCYVTNVFKIRPTDNQIDEFLCFLRKPPAASWRPVGKAWVHPEVSGHIEMLKKELSLVKPNVAVALGNTAMWALTNQTGIQKWRGSILESTLVPGLKVIPVTHPAALARMWSWRWDLAQDFRRIKRESAHPQINHPAWRFRIRPSLQDVMDCLEIIEKTDDLISVDIETSKGKDCYITSCIGLAWTNLDALCIPLEKKDGSSYWTAEEEAHLMYHLLRVLKKSKIVGQNFLYDSYFFALFNGVKLTPHIDTLLAMHFLFPGKPKKLYEQASLYCEFYRYWKDEGKIVDAKIPDEQLWMYNCQDVVYTREVAQVQERLLTARDPALWQFMKDRWDSAFELMMRGINIDTTKRAECKQIMHSIQEACKRQLDHIFSEDFNPQSNPRMKFLVKDEFGVPLLRDRQTESDSVNDTAMDQYQEQEPLLKPIFNRIRRYRSARVLASTILNAEGPQNRAYCSFNPAGPETFRWSSSKNPQRWGFNQQNIARDDEEPDLSLRFPSLRSLFIPDSGFFLWEVDLAKADLHVVVWEAADLELKQALRNGDDIYTIAMREADLKIPRQDGKMFTHLTNYGGTARVAAIAARIKVAQAEEAQRLWFRKHPGIKNWHLRVDEEIKRSRSVTNQFGLRIIYFDRTDNVLKEALAWCPQTTVANVTDFAIINLRKEFKGDLVQVLLNGHDSVLGQAREECRSYIGPLIRRQLQITIPYPDPLQIPWDLKIGNPSWGEAKPGCWTCMQIKENCQCVLAGC